ncbi:outer membrane protein assembly factor [Flavobacterium geliluteum]|uniref:outer membrane protein assembly factor n=1 Tax=Flavobacterium geliluteum TaxID=2816120 RepID=UPI001F3F91B7|nr:outer membrane protein assembly factor [Flavobacterium geliluteum]
MSDEQAKTSDALIRKGYLDLKLIENSKLNDTTYIHKINLGARTKNIHIYIGRNNPFYDVAEIKNDTIIIPYQEIENHLNQKIIEREKQGFALNKLSLTNIQRKNLIMYADLNYNSEKKRVVNSIIVNYTDNNRTNYFPKSHLKQLNKKYISKTFNQDIVKELNSEINNYAFALPSKYPEILFTTDSTKIYLYIEKRKANNFDGYIGFTNDENKKLNINGYLDVTLQNILRSGEQFSLYWKSDGNQQRTFDTKLEIPYIFNSSLGIKAQLNIFKQDSTFQNSKNAIDLGYYLKYNSKIYLGYQSTESSDIQNANSISVSDFKNSFFTTSFDYIKMDNLNDLFPKKTSINLIIGFGKRNTNAEPQTLESSKQVYTNLTFSYNFELNKKNYININLQNFYLKSQNYLTNELFRFGGSNSIRGFIENSLQANYVSALITEYRYIVSRNLYLHSITDYAIYQDLTRSNNPKKIEKLIGLGAGLGLQTQNGIIKINISNSVHERQKIELYNTIINICYNVKF